MNISEVIKNRTSLRVYDDRMIEDQDLEKILEAASLAPTAGNQQLYSIITSWRAARSFLSGSPGFSGKLPMNRI